MAKIKMTVRTPRMDMTPMVDLFCLLLTFFMLTTTFRPQEAVEVKTPTSVAENLAPDLNVLTIYVSKEGKVFFNLDNGRDTSMHIRSKVLEDVSRHFQVPFSKAQLKKFEKLASFGMPIKNLGAWIDAGSGSAADAMQIGMPIDSTNNELVFWILYSRNQNKDLKVDVKGDSDADYKIIDKVFAILRKNNVLKFNLTTTLEKVEIKPDELNF
jgi:biopolymer transport protein ExbD